MNQNPKIGVAIIGLGTGQQHLSSYTALEVCSVLWVLDKDVKKAKYSIRNLTGCQVANYLEDILSDPKVDIVSIASYDSDHYEHVMAALGAEKHVFVEKPICRNLQELKAIKDLWALKNYDLKLASNLVLRSAPLYQWLKGVIESDGLGEVYSFDGDYLYGRLNKITDGWRSIETKYSVLLGGGIHLIDLMLWLTGQKPRNVFSVGNRICTKNTRFKYNDYVSSTFLFESGMIGRVTANFGCVHRHHHIIRIFGTRGTFIYDDKGPRLHRSRSPSSSPVTVKHSSLPRTKGELIPSFVLAILEDLDWNSNVQNTFDTMSVSIASQDATGKNSAQEVNYI